MNQSSLVPFGTSTTDLNGYAQAAGDRLGNFDLIFENIGDNAVNIDVKELNAAGTSYATVLVNTGSIVARGTKTVSVKSVSKRLGFFTNAGGNTSVNISTAIRNKGDLRGAQIDIVATGKRGWGLDVGHNPATTQKRWGLVPDQPTNAESSGWGTSDPSQADA